MYNPLLTEPHVHIPYHIKTQKGVYLHLYLHCDHLHYQLSL